MDQTPEVTAASKGPPLASSADHDVQPPLAQEAKPSRQDRVSSLIKATQDVRDRFLGLPEDDQKAVDALLDEQWDERVPGLTPRRLLEAVIDQGAQDDSHRGRELDEFKSAGAERAGEVFVGERMTEADGGKVSGTFFVYTKRPDDGYHAISLVEVTGALGNAPHASEPTASVEIYEAANAANGRGVLILNNRLSILKMQTFEDGLRVISTTEDIKRQAGGTTILETKRTERSIEGKKQ